MFVLEIGLIVQDGDEWCFFKSALRKKVYFIFIFLNHKEKIFLVMVKLDRDGLPRVLELFSPHLGLGIKLKTSEIV